MDRYIGLDAHASSCTLGVLGPGGKRLGSDVVETNAKALIEVLRCLPGPRHLCLNEGTWPGMAAPRRPGVTCRGEAAYRTRGIGHRRSLIYKVRPTGFEPVTYGLRGLGRARVGAHQRSRAAVFGILRSQALTSARGCCDSVCDNYWTFNARGCSLSLVGRRGNVGEL